MIPSLFDTIDINYKPVKGRPKTFYSKSQWRKVKSRRKMAKMSRKRNRKNK